MAGLKIAEITNATLKALAYLEDKDSEKGILCQAEFEIFKQKAGEKVENGEISAEDFNQAMGLFKTEDTTVTNPVEETTAPAPLTRKQQKAANKEKTNNQDHIKNDMEAIIEGNKNARLREDSSITLENLAEKLAKKNSNPIYAETIAEVKGLTDKVTQIGFNSKKEVEALEKKLKDDKKLSDFQKSIAGYVVELAKRDQIAKETKVIVGIYNEIKADKNRAQNFTKYIEAVKDEMEKRGLKGTSYYSDEAFKAFEVIVAQDVQTIIDDKKRDMVKKGDTSDSEKKVKDTLLNSTPETDKFAQKVIKKDKDMNALTGRWIDRDRRAEELEDISEKELRKELGNELFELLNSKYLYKAKKENGNYNVRELSDKLFESVGYDVWMNMSDDTKMSEMQGAKRALKVLTGRDLTDKDVKKIMKLVHIKKEPKDRNLLHALKDSIIPGIASGLSAAISYRSLDATQKLRIEIDDNNSTQQLISDLQSQGIPCEVGKGSNGTVTITLMQHVLKNNRALMALAGAGIGILSGVVMSMIFGMEKNEKSCFSIADFDLTKETYTDIDKYEEYVRNTEDNDNKANLIVNLAKAYHAKYGDDWAKHYDSDIKKFAGQGSVLNCLEFRGGVLFGATKLEDNDNDSDDNNDDSVESCPVSVEPDGNETTVSTDNTFIHNRKKGDSWKGIIDAYYPDLLKQYKGQYYGNNGAIRALQKELCKNDNGELDTQKLKQLYTATDLPKTMKLPSQVEGATRIKGNVVPTTINKPNNPKKPMDQVGRDEVSIKHIPSGVYIATDGCNNQTASGSNPKEAVVNLEKTTGKKYSNRDEYLK